MMRDLAPDSLPLARARRWYGWRALGLAALALALIVVLVIAQSPPALRRGGLTLAALLVLMCVGVGGLSLVWTWMIAWPLERRRLQGAARTGAVAVGSPARDEPRGQVAALVVGGLLVGALLWCFLNTIGLVGTPMLWIVVGTINAEVARRVGRVERAERAVYYEIPAPFPFIAGRRLFAHRQPATVSQPSATGAQGVTVRERATATRSKRRTTTGRAPR